MENDAPYAPPPPATGPVPPPPEPKRGRWKKVLLFSGIALAALVLLVVLAGPSVVASLGKSTIESVLGEKLDSAVTVGRLSLGWSGHVDLDGLKIAPRGFSSPLLEVREVNVDVSLPSAIGGKYIARVEVVAPKIVIEKDASGRFNYDFPKPKEEPKGESGKESAGASRPYVQAELKVREGEVVVRDRGRETVFRNVTVEARVDTLEKPVEYSLSLENPTHGKLSVKGSFDIDRKSGPLLLVLERISLKNLAALAGAYGGVQDLDGTAEGTFEYRILGVPAFSGKGRLEVKDLSMAMGDRKVRLDRLSLVHEGALDERGNGWQKLALSSGQALDASLTADVTDALGTPGAKIDFQADSDLAELGRVVQGLIGLKPDLRFEGKVKVRGRAETKGPDLKAAKAEIAAKADLQLDAADLAVVDKEDKRYEIDRAIALKVAGSWDGKTSTGTLETVKLDSSFATVDGRGGASLGKNIEIRDSSITLKADLEKLAGKLKSFMEKPPALGGTIALTAKATGERLEVDGTLKGLRFEKIGPLNVTLKHEGTLDKKGNGKHTLTLTSGKALDAMIAADVTDVFGVPGAIVDIRADSDLAELGQTLQGLIEIKPGMRLEGKAKVRGRAETKGPDPKAAKGEIAAKADLQLDATDVAAVEKDGKRFEIDRLIALKLAGAWDGKTSAGTLETLKLDSSFATVDGKGGASLGKNIEIRDSSVTLKADLEKLAKKLKSFMEKPPALGGTADVTAKVAGERMGVDGTLKGIRFADMGPMDATLKHEGTLDPKGSGRHRFLLESGQALRVEGTADVKDLMAEARSVVGSVKVEGDLGLLSNMLPSLLETKPGTTLAGSATLTATFETKGSTFAKFDVDAGARDVEAVERVAKKRQELEKSATLAVKGSWDGARSAVVVETAKVASSCITLEGRGRISLGDKQVQDSSFTLKADLGRLGAKLPLFMQDPPGLAGSVTADGKYAGDRYEVDAAVKDLKVVMKRDGKESVAGPIDATIVQKGVFEVKPGGKLKIEESRIASNALDLTVTGEVRKVMEESREGDLKFDLAARPAELSKWIPDLGMGGPEIKVIATATLRPKLVTTTGKTQVDGLTITGKDAAGAIVTRIAKTGPLEFSVEMKDKDVLAKVSTALFEWVDKGYTAKGGLEAAVSYNGEKGTSGITKVANLEIVDDKKNVVKDPAVTVVHDVGMSPGAYDIRKAEVTSTFIRGGLTGKVKNFDKEPEFANVRGSFKYVPDKLGAVLAPWMPGKLEGVEERTIEIKLDGKAKAAEVLAILRASEGSMDVDLAKYTHTGISVSGKTRLDLKDGQAKSATPLQVNKGRTEMDLSLDFREPGKKPRSTLDFRAKEVEANADMGPLLEKIHPIFFTNKVGATVDGKVDSDFRLTWEGPIDPGEKDWVAAASRSMGGTGVFSAKNLAIVGSPTVEMLMEALGAGNRLEGELAATDIRIAGGRCVYKDMTLRLKRYELRFSGWVGFDRKMELMVEMPMTEHIVKKYPNLQKYIGKTFFVPLEGTVNSPRFDFDRAIAELLKRAMEGVIQDKAKDLLDDLFKKKKKKDP